MKAKFTGSQQEFEEFYQRLKAHQPASNDEVVFMFEADPSSELVQDVEHISFADDLGEDDIFHTNNREWLLNKLSEADEDINAGRVVPSSKALFDDVIKRGRERLKERGQ